jgi:phenylacetyl-CoA:acceptor oxidoreductase
MEATERKVPVYCYQCVAGPDLLCVKTHDGVATEVEPNFAAAEVHPAAGKICVKAYGLIQKTYNPNRVLTPMKRTNPRKGREHDPGFVPIGWDEALGIVAAKLNEIRGRGLVDESGYPRLAASFGGGGTAVAYLGTFPAFLAAWGPIDQSFGSGQGVKCYHSEHLYGELWHRAFTVCPDTPLTEYILSFGANIEASGGVTAVWRHAEARARGLKRVQIEPHLSITGACSAEWVAIKPKTDAAFLFAMIHLLVHETPRERLDLAFLGERTASPYLIGPNGYFLRDRDREKPLVWDGARGEPVPFDTAGAEPALEGTFTVDAIEIGPDGERWQHSAIRAETAFSRLVAQVAPYTPEWAEQTCDIPSGTIARITAEYLAHAKVGATVDIEGTTLPLRPVAISLGKTVTNGWGGYECCWARTLLACLIGGLEVPGGTLGTTVRLNRPATSRQATVARGPDGFMDYPMNPTDKESWQPRPHIRNAHDALVPLSANSPWSAALGPSHLAWMFRKQTPANWPQVTAPDIWFVYRTNPSISFWDTPELTRRIAEFPFVVAFAYTFDETNTLADILLPECTDLESTQLIRIGGTGYLEQFWDHEGFALRQPAVEPRGESRDFTDIATELAVRTGLLKEYNQAINDGGATLPLSGERYDHRLDRDRRHTSAEIWDAVCRAATAELTEGAESEGLEWFQRNGYRTRPMSRLRWYLYPEFVSQGIRFEMPYQERLLRIGTELANRLHEHDIDWWDRQLEEYQALPQYKDFPGVWERAAVRQGGTPEDTPFWLLTTRSMQYAWGANASLQMIDEVAGNIGGHRGVVMNAGRAAKLGIADGDMIEVRSALRATKGRAVLRQGIRPDTLLMAGQFDHWATPYAKDRPAPSMNPLVPMSLELTDATGSSADIVRVAVRRLDGAAS